MPEPAAEPAQVSIASEMYGSPPDMTEEKADALDELWSKTTPPLKGGAGGNRYRWAKNIAIPCCFFLSFTLYS